MSERNPAVLVIALASAACLFACKKTSEEGDSSRTPSAIVSPAKPASNAEAAVDKSPGKPTAPVSIEYDIVGKAIVGQPVGINLRVLSHGRGQPVTLHYRVNDSSAMVFPESQAQRIEMPGADDRQARMQQVTVIPQREGRLFLNVSAEVATENGMMYRSLAIPLQVGAGSQPPAVNGELTETADGETVISMPASESGGS